MTTEQITKNYLTERSLHEYLKIIFPNEKIVHDKVIEDSGIKNRPDFRIESKKLIVEFDGYAHFTNPLSIVNDIKKDDVYSSMGYTIIRIPYFVQLDEVVLTELFGSISSVDFKSIASQYPHGFIDKKAILPARYCTIGLARFQSTLEDFSFHNISRKVLDSLLLRPELKRSIQLVYPSTLLKRKWAEI